MAFTATRDNLCENGTYVMDLWKMCDNPRAVFSISQRYRNVEINYFNLNSDKLELRKSKKKSCCDIVAFILLFNDGKR